MIVKILGLLDVFAGLLFWIFRVFNVDSLGGLVLILGLFLLVKGVAFAVTLDAISVLDIVSGLIIILESSVDLPIFIVIIVSLFLLQKGIFSMLG